MFEIVFLVVLGLLWVIFATIQDVRTREIANWLNFSLIAFALGFRFFYSFFMGDSFLVLGNFFYQGLIGFGIFLILGNLLYYGRLFAGGDAKLMIALGAVLPFSYDFFINLKYFGLFLALFLFVGAVYGLVYSLFLALTNIGVFKKEFLKLLKKYKNIVYITPLIAIIFLAFAFMNNMFLLVGGFIFLLPYFYIYAKAVDSSCMVKKVRVGKLTEGDWLFNDLKVGKKVVKASWGGLTKEDIKLINKCHKNILIRNGIPFSPVFLISFLLFIGMWFLKINFMGIFG